MGELLELGMVALVAGLGAYFGTYLKEKAKNLATHEDLNKLIGQMEATTRAAKAIEARIPNEVWDRQRQWELKRDTLFDMVRAVGEFQQAFLRLSVLEGLPSEKSEELRKERAQKREEARETWRLALDKIDRFRLLTFLVCSKDTQATLGKL